MKLPFFRCISLLTLTTAILSGCTTIPTTTTVNLGQNTRIFTHLKSVKSLRDKNVVKQGFDYSCGAGALATLLTYGVGDSATEAEILLQLLNSLPKDKELLKKKEGFSLADLQNVALIRGHKSAGFRMSPEHLAKLKGPVIVFIQPRGYKHFAVLKGVKGDRIYLADPSLGNIRLPAYKFLDDWLDETGKGVIFVVEANDGWPTDYPLKLKEKGIAQPEVMSMRQLLNVGNSLMKSSGYPR
ncbi:MAG: C39 family peptidase [Methylococcaceae bacterium]